MALILSEPSVTVEERALISGFYDVQESVLRPGSIFPSIDQRFQRAGGQP